MEARCSAGAFRATKVGAERLTCVGSSHARYLACALENDDRRFTPEVLLPLCERLGIPMVYDVHHHRCNPDSLDVRGATERAAATWGAREPHFHISSPRAGWTGGDRRPHADYISANDFPEAWRGRALTVDVEAKAKERAVLAIRADLGVATEALSAKL